MNVEPALRAGEPLGGHLVQGHVDGVGRVRRVDDEGLEIEAPEDLLRYCVEKGSIAVEGVSLTIAGARREARSRSRSSRTRARSTTLGAVSEGDELNLEADIVAKHVERLLERCPRHGGVPGRASRLRSESDERAGRHEGARSPPSRRRSRTSARGSSWWSSTRPTGRTRATSPSPRSSPRRRRSTSWPRTAAGSSASASREERCDELGLKPMTYNNETPFETAFTISIEAREGVTTGISAADRAHTIQVAIDPTKGPGDLVQPGHVFPLRARPGRRAPARRADRGRRRPRPSGRPQPGRRRLRDHERGRDDGPRARPRSRTASGTGSSS